MTEPEVVLWRFERKLRCFVLPRRHQLPHKERQRARRRLRAWERAFRESAS